MDNKLTDEELAILGHVVVDPEAWVQHAYATVGAEAVEAKIARYRPEYEAAKAVEGYKNRAARDAELEAK
jgi:hypothetical protein